MTENQPPPGNLPGNSPDDRQNNNERRRGWANETYGAPQAGRQQIPWGNAAPTGYGYAPQQSYPAPYPGGPYGQPPQNPRKPLWKRWWFWLLTVLLVIVLAFCTIVALLVYVDVQLRDEAADQCREKVLEHAKYPGGVVFQDEPEVDDYLITTNNRDNEIWTMGGDVDFPNGFGTPVRMKYVCFSEISDFEVINTEVLVTETRS